MHTNWCALNAKLYKRYRQGYMYCKEHMLSLIAQFVRYSLYTAKRDLSGKSSSLFCSLGECTSYIAVKANLWSNTSTTFLERPHFHLGCGGLSRQVLLYQYVSQAHHMCWPASPFFFTFQGHSRPNVMVPLDYPYIVSYSYI